MTSESDHNLGNLPTTGPEEVETVAKVIEEFETSPEELAQQTSRPDGEPPTPEEITETNQAMIDDAARSAAEDAVNGQANGETLTRSGVEPESQGPTDPNETPMKQRRPRKPRKPPTAAPTSGLEVQPQIGLEDEFLTEELTGYIRDHIANMNKATAVWQSAAAKKYRDADAERKKQKAAIVESLPMDGKAHMYRVDGFVVGVGLPSEEKTSTRRSKQRVTIKEAPGS